jgi:hypothetical protein
MKVLNNLNERKNDGSCNTSIRIATSESIPSAKHLHPKYWPNNLTVVSAKMYRVFFFLSRMMFTDVVGFSSHAIPSVHNQHFWTNFSPSGNHAWGNLMNCTTITNFKKKL